MTGNSRFEQAEIDAFAKRVEAHAGHLETRPRLPTRATAGVRSGWARAGGAAIAVTVVDAPSVAARSPGPMTPTCAI